MIEDLKPSDNSGVMTPERAFTIAQLIVLRVRDEAYRTEDERAVLDRAADLIADAERSWRS